VSIESGQRLRRCFDQVEFQILPGTGHLPYEECPETLGRLVNSFLSKMREGAGPQLVRSKGRPA
jgi:pimeloyl-ACP methyl ester carboxylesterase